MIRFGTTPEIIGKPLYFGIENSLFHHHFKLIARPLVQNCQDLLAGKLDAALVSAVDYARHGSQLKLLQDFAVYSAGPAKYALLFFREHLQNIDQIAFRELASQYQILANLVLEEFFELEIDWQPLPAIKSLEDILMRFPACLLEAEAALENYRQFRNKLDILEEWTDKTGLDYIHQLVAVRKDMEDMEIADTLHRSREMGMGNLMQIARESAGGAENSREFYSDVLKEDFRYFPAEDTWDSLRQYFEYLFYYGVVDFMPDLHFY